ncbi:phosphoenolpyruvate hydrolase family protein [Sulfitobacter sp. AS92]|uniref:phosphoenolpyruvate hydrolase family protein n=1 Tax=Sulfitobacter sp. AS92 TaxID=3135783 RepID=UPI00317823BC
MMEYLLTGTLCSELSRPETIFCPSLRGLSAAQADLAFLMPRMDHNRTLRETQRGGDWAAILASDPFGSEAAIFRQLTEMGYLGITNWPSSILLDGALRQSMSTIPASPESEYAYLARAQTAGLKAMAFFRSLDQARSALEAGLKTLVLHPGILNTEDTNANEMLLGSLSRLVDALREDQRRPIILAYTSVWHECRLSLRNLPVDGFVCLEAAP